jgi:hypothetical protein
MQTAFPQLQPVELINIHAKIICFVNHATATNTTIAKSKRSAFIIISPTFI